jgi:hypothetical protein
LSLGIEIIFCILTIKFRIYLEISLTVFLVITLLKINKIFFDFELIQENHAYFKIFEFVLIIFKRNPQRHRRSLVAIPNEIGVPKFFQTAQMKAPVKNGEIGKNRYNYKLNRRKIFGKL